MGRLRSDKRSPLIEILAAHADALRAPKHERTTCSYGPSEPLMPAIKDMHELAGRYPVRLSRRPPVQHDAPRAGAGHVLGGLPLGVRLSATSRSISQSRRKPDREAFVRRGLPREKIFAQKTASGPMTTSAVHTLGTSH